MLSKKLLYILAALLLFTTLTAYAVFGETSGVLKDPISWLILGLLPAIPLVVAIALDRMYTAPRLPKDISWLWLVLFGCLAFICSNIVALASRQSTMQYGTIITTLDLLGLFDASYISSKAMRLEALAMHAAMIVGTALVFFIPAYAHWGKQRKKRGES